jgi:glycopeptide antibiotics resistance protein
MSDDRQHAKKVGRCGSVPEVSWPRRAHFALLSAATIAVAVYGSLVPLRFTPLSFTTALDRFADIPMLSLGVESRADWVANILLFVPIGFFFLGALSVDLKGRSSILAIFPVVVGCIALSVAIEFTQLWFPPRTVSQNDIVAEAIGGLVGCVLWMFAGHTLTDWLRTFTGDTKPGGQIDWLLQAYLLGLLIYSVLPLDLTISVADLYRKFADGRVVVVPFSSPPALLFDWVLQLAKDVIVFVPIGAWSATAFVGRGQAIRSLSQSVLIGGLIVVAIELAQLFVFSRFSDTTDLITGTTGVAIGAAWMRRWRGGKAVPPTTAAVTTAYSAGLLWLALAAVYAALITAGYWFPLDFSMDRQIIEERLAGFFSVPFSKVYFGSEYQAISNVVQKMLLFAPLGALVTIAAHRLPVPDSVRRILLAGLLAACFAVGLGIELGQVVSPRHTPDFTDVLVYTGGALIGMVVTGRLQRGRSSLAPRA